MACCIFVVMLVRQLLAPFLWLHGQIFGRSRERGSTAAGWAPPARIATEPTWRSGVTAALEAQSGAIGTTIELDKVGKPG